MNGSLMDKVLLIDDDIELCQLLIARMEGEGFELNASHDGERGLELAISGENSLIVLDLMLPGLSGLEVLRRVRDRTNVPVLILTARGEEVDRILGLELGADDYVSKPFNVRELIARMRAILRRTGNTTRGTADYVAGDIRLVPAAREVWVQDRRISLTGTEFTLL